MLRALTLWAMMNAAATPAAGQSDASKLDSLEKAVARAGEDTVKARSLCRLCMELNVLRRHDEAIKYGKAGLALGLRLRDKRGVAECHNKIGVAYWRKSEYDSARSHYLQAVEAYTRVGNDRGLADAYNNLGNVYDDLHEYAAAVESYQRAATLYRRADYVRGLATVYNNLGSVYRNQGDFAAAADFFLQSLHIKERTGDVRGTANSYNNLGMVYRVQGQIERAAQAYLKSLELRQMAGDESGAAAAYFNLGLLRLRENDFTRAEEHFRKSLQIHLQNGEQNGVADCHTALADVFKQRGNYAGANEFYRQALSVFERIGDKDGAAVAWSGLAEMCLLTGRPQLARQYARGALELAKETGNVESLTNLALTMARADSAVGDFRAAFEHHKLFHRYADSLRNDEQTRKIAQVETRRHFEQELEEKKRREEQEAEIAAERQERIYMFQSLGIFAFIMLLLFSLFVLGKLHLPRRVVKALMFVSLIMTFEFALVLFDPINEKYSQGLPVMKMAFNTGIALILWPIHHWVERKLTQRLAPFEQHKTAT